MPGALTPVQHREARLAQAMLPVGVAVVVASALAFPAVLLLGVAARFAGRHWLAIDVWAIAAAAVAWRNFFDRACNSVCL